MSSLLSCFNVCLGRARKASDDPSVILHKALATICGDGDVGLPGDATYAEWSKPYNRDKLMAVSPAAIVRPRDAQEVAEVVKYAAKNGYKLQARSGGHSYANFSLGGPGATNVIVVDLAKLRNITVDTVTWHAKIGSGCLLGDVTEKLHEQGGRAFAHGICPGVGIGGHGTIGGLGPMSRMWGSCLDHILQVEVVTADGSVVVASDTENSDLFFGLRGAGASFGIITEFTMRTHPEPTNAVQYSYTFAFGEHDMAQVFRAWQDLIYDPELDRRLGTLFIITGAGAVIEAIFYGSPEEFVETGIPARLPQPSESNVVLHGWLGHLAHLASVEGLKASNIATPFYSKSLGFRRQDKLSDERVDEVFKYVHDAQKGRPDAYFIIFTAQGGATNDVAPDATAYAHRDKVMFYENYIINIPSINEDNKRFFTGLHDTLLKSLATPSPAAITYPGYADLELGTGEKAGPSYWGENYSKLQRLKSKWDPQELFHNAQSVRPSN